MKVNVRCLGDDEYELAVRSLDRWWERGHVYTRDKALFDWSFRRHDVWERRGYSFAVAELNAEPVGQMGAIPFVLNRFGESSKGFWTANWSMAPGMRSGGSGQRLLYEFQQPPFTTAIIFGTVQALLPLMGAMNWQVVEGMPRFFAVLENGVAAFDKLLRQAQKSWSEPRRDALTEAFLLHLDGAGVPGVVRALPEDWDETTWVHIARKTVGAARDRAFLEWRYENHPSFSYRFVAVPLKKGWGLAIWRPEIVEAETPEGTVQKIGTFGRLVEFLASPGEDASMLSDALIDDLAEAGAFAVDYFGYNGAAGHALESNGILPVTRHPDGQHVPARLQPVDGKRTSILSAVDCPHPAPEPDFAPACPWLWTKGDGDQDRPR